MRLTFIYVTNLHCSIAICSPRYLTRRCKQQHMARCGFFNNGKLELLCKSRFILLSIITQAYGRLIALLSDRRNYRSFLATQPRYCFCIGKDQLHQRYAEYRLVRGRSAHPARLVLFWIIETLWRCSACIPKHCLPPIIPICQEFVTTISSTS